MSSHLIGITGLLWAGMILGISFLESWAKFRTPSLSKEIGLDVGRTVFRIFHKTQNILLIILLLMSIVLKISSISWAMLTILIFITLIQYKILFPKLDYRVNSILAGNTLAASSIHTLYGIFELTKLFILIIFSINTIL